MRCIFKCPLLACISIDLKVHSPGLKFLVYSPVYLIGKQYSVNNDCSYTIYSIRILESDHFPSFNRERERRLTEVSQCRID